MFKRRTVNGRDFFGSRGVHVCEQSDCVASENGIGLTRRMHADTAYQFQSPQRIVVDNGPNRIAADHYLHNGWPKGALFAVAKHRRCAHRGRDSHPESALLLGD